MLKIIETGILFFCLPFLAVGALALLINATWWGVFITLLVICSPFIALYVAASVEWIGRDADRKARDASMAKRHVHQAQLPGRPDDVAQKEQKNLPLKLPLGNQWRV